MENSLLENSKKQTLQEETHSNIESYEIFSSSSLENSKIENSNYSGINIQNTIPLLIPTSSITNKNSNHYNNNLETPNFLNENFINEETNIKGLNIITNYEGKNQKIVMTLNVNLFKLALPKVNNIIPALSKPSFCPEDMSKFVCGTEEQDILKKSKNYLFFSTINDSSISVNISYPISDHIRDIQWVDKQIVIFAMNHKLGLVRMNLNYSIDDLIMFPEFHKDTIREICVGNINKNLVISGGFDGNVFVTDISRLCSDIQKNEKKSENSLYPCRDVVGSVSWHPQDAYLASCTTDTGTLHIFDIRTDKRRPAIVFDTKKKELYTHAYYDNFTMFLGYGDGTIFVFDARMKKTIMGFEEPHQKQIGEIKFDYDTKNFAIFGVPGFTLWDYQDQNINLYAHHQLADNSFCFNGTYKTSGDFRKGTRTLGVTDRYPIFIFIFFF